MRPKLFAVCAIWLLGLTAYINTVVAYDVNSGYAVNNAVESFQNVEDESLITQSTSMISVYWNILFFEIEGLNFWLNLLVLAPTLVIGAIIIEYVLELIPG